MRTLWTCVLDGVHGDRQAHPRWLGFHKPATRSSKTSRSRIVRVPALVADIPPVRDAGVESRGRIVADRPSSAPLDRFDDRRKASILRYEAPESGFDRLRRRAGVGRCAERQDDGLGARLEDRPTGIDPLPSPGGRYRTGPRRAAPWPRRQRPPPRCRPGRRRGLPAAPTPTRRSRRTGGGRRRSKPSQRRSCRVPPGSASERSRLAHPGCRR